MEVAVAIQKDYLFGLTYAHDRSSPIVHRDINGDNIVLSYSKGKIRALLADFGLAAISDEVSWSNSAAGRYGFMAPECFLDLIYPRVMYFLRNGSVSNANRYLSLASVPTQPVIPMLM